jgi:Ca-activated chloride channel family protein
MSQSKGRILGIAVIALLVTACGGAAAPTPTSTAAPASAPIAATAETSPSAGPGGPATLDAPQTIEAGKSFEVTWTGPNALNDYVTIVAATATKWTNESYFSTSVGSPSTLTASSKAGAYEIWYVSGADSAILARRAITVTAFSGSLQAPDSVAGGTVFDVAWTGPNGPGDYVTIVKAGTTKWTNESYFSTSVGSPATLVAALEAGAYEICYVIGVDSTFQARRPITVTAPVVTLQAPAEVGKGASFQVAWTGPNGPGDYITIVPVGSAVGTYASYANTSSGSPVTLKAPDAAGLYEIWYAVSRGSTSTNLKTIPITVK